MSNTTRRAGRQTSAQRHRAAVRELNVWDWQLRGDPTLVCTPSSLAQLGVAALGAMAGEARLRQVLAEAGYTRVRRVAQQAAPFNIVLEARP